MGGHNNDKCVAVASASSRKAIAIALSIKKVLDLPIVGIFDTYSSNIYSKLFDRKIINNINKKDKWIDTILYSSLKYNCNIVIPVRFTDVLLLSKHKDLFESHGIRVAAPPYDSVKMASDKSRLNELIGHYGNVPHYIVIKKNHPKEYYYKINDIKPPFVVKGLGDNASPEYFMDARKALKEAIKRAPCIIQEYIAGRARGYFVLAFNGVPLIEFTHERVVEYYPWGGASIVAKGPINDPKLYSIGRSIINKLKWDGIMMIETKWVPETGEYYIIELNPKFWGSIALPVALGFHFPALFVKALLDTPKEAKKLAEKLQLYHKEGRYIWLLTSMHYINLAPYLMLKLTMNVVKNPLNTDLYPFELPRITISFFKNILNLNYRKNNIIYIIEKIKKKIYENIKQVKKIFIENRFIIIDFDKTLFYLPINWRKVLEYLIKEGYGTKYDNIQIILNRIWKNKREQYNELSNIIKNIEYKYINKVKILIDKKMLHKLVSKNVKICIASKQSEEVIAKVLRLNNMDKLFIKIIGRDSGYGPLKEMLYQACRKDFIEKPIVIDDNLHALVSASRLGMYPMRACFNEYECIKSMRLGIISGSTNYLLYLLNKIIYY